ncbi:MAG: hypothetical protein RR064_03080 [Oscillospiraceae bacterium]
MKKAISLLLVAILCSACNTANLPDKSSSTDNDVSQSQSSVILESSSSKESNSSEQSSEKAEDVVSTENSSSSSSAETVKTNVDASKVEDTSKKESPNPAKKNWTLAYDTFYSGIKGVKAADIKKNDYTAVKIRNELVYPIYIANNLEDLSNISEDKSMPEEIIYGAVLENLDGSYYGEATIDDNQFTQVSPFAVGNYGGRTSMTITEGIEKQLEKTGEFTPENTKAYALILDNLGQGIVFDNGKTKLFYMLSIGSYSAQYIEYGTMIDFCSLSTEYEKIINEIANNAKVNNSDKPAVDINPATGKPIIYLYPEKETDVKVQLDYKGDFSYTYPKYDNGWNVTAYPDGKIINKADNSEHYYLFWEGNKKIDWDFSKGFIVKGADTEKFLKEKLELLGMTPREYNDFITYWAPEMVQNEANLVTFAYEQYEELAPLKISPTPDTILRVHMVYKKYNGEAKPQPQELKLTPRKGFTVVEWGGTRA